MLLYKRLLCTSYKGCSDSLNPLFWSISITKFNVFYGYKWSGSRAIIIKTSVNAPSQQRCEQVIQVEGKMSCIEVTVPNGNMWVRCLRQV